MEKGKDIKSITINLTPIFHYNFTNKNGKVIKTTKFMTSNREEYLISGNSDLLNEEELFVEYPHKVYYDGNKWIVLE